MSDYPKLAIIGMSAESVLARILKIESWYKGSDADTKGITDDRRVKIVKAETIDDVTAGNLIDTIDLDRLKKIVDDGELVEYQKTIMASMVYQDEQIAEGRGRRKRRKFRSKNTHLTPKKKRRR